MIAGNEQMPNPKSNEMMYGNQENGYARITFLGL